MITQPDAPQRENRILRTALLASLLVHVLGALVGLLGYDVARRALHVNAPAHHRTRPDEIVTISSAIHFEKRPVPVRAARHQRVLAPHRAAPPPALAKVDVRKPALPRPAVLRHALAAPRTHPAPRPRVARARPTPGARQRKAVASRPASPPQTARLSTERLAQIERDLSKTIAQARSETDPLRAPREPPAAPKRYPIQMQGAFGKLRRGEGYYYPVKSWRANGFDYYYVTYEFTWPDGTYERGSVPWPIHFPPETDPFASSDPTLIHHTPLPPPPPGYMPPGTLGKALRAYFPKLVFSDG